MTSKGAARKEARSLPFVEDRGGWCQWGRPHAVALPVMLFLCTLVVVYWPERRMFMGPTNVDGTTSTLAWHDANGTLSGGLQRPNSEDMLATESHGSVTDAVGGGSSHNAPIELPVPPTTITNLTQFASFCDDYRRTHFQNKPWSMERGYISSVLSQGDELVCTRGRKLFRLNQTSPTTWTQTSGSFKGGRMPPLPIGGLPLEHVAQESDVVWHPHTAVVSTALLSMFHLLNDLLLPLHAALHEIYGSVRQPAPIDEGVLDLVLLYLDKQNRGHDNSDPATVAFARSMVPRGGSLRLLIDPAVVDRETTLHCYCRVIWQPGSALMTMPPSARLIEGDRFRRAATRHVQRRLNDQFRFLPLNTHPIPIGELQGLWDAPPATASPGAHDIRLLFMLRNKSRLIGNVAEIVDIARRIGYNVCVMTPEFETVERQARAARYSDVIMAMHGQALTWMLLMDTLRTAHCRQVVELRHYGRRLKRIHNVYEVLAADNYLTYRSIRADDATFDMRFVSSREGEKKLMLRKPFPHRLRGFKWQTATYAAHDVVRTLREAFAHAVLCVPRNVQYNLTAGDIARSDKMGG